MLTHYRKSIKDFYNYFESVKLDIDFRENLTLPVKHQPQSLHWSYTQITIHSGILKSDGEKIYHAYIYVSDNLKHDQTFVKISIAKMVENGNMDNIHIIIESDNSSSQFKSAKHFHDF